MTAPDTDTLAGLLAEATPGEWEEITPEGGIWPPRVFSGSTIVSMVDNSDMTHGEKVANARLIALAPELAAEVISLRAQAAKDKARIERLEAALRPFADEAAMWGDLVPNDHAPLCVEMGHTDGAYYGSAAKYTVGDLRAARAALEDA